MQHMYDTVTNLRSCIFVDVCISSQLVLLADINQWGIVYKYTPSSCIHGLDSSILDSDSTGAWAGLFRALASILGIGA